MYVCVCAAVKSAEIEKELHKGATLQDLQMKYGVACNCCCCLESILEMLTNKYSDGTPTTNQQETY